MPALTPTGHWHHCYQVSDGYRYSVGESKYEIVKDANNEVSCKGQTVNIGGELIDDILIITQTKVVIQEEDFILTGRNIEAVDDHLILECSPSSGGCRSNRKNLHLGQS